MEENNLGHLKICLLIEGMDITEEAKEGLGTLWQEKIYSYSLTDWTTEKIVLPSDIKLGEKVYVGFRYNPKSNWILEKKDESLRVLINRKTGKKYDVKLISRPKYYTYKTTDGKKMQSVGVSCGNHGVSFFINSYCQYFSKNEQCRFCGLVPTQKKFNDTVKLKKISQVSETMKKILELGDRVDFVQFSGGSKYNHDQEVREYIPFIEAVHKELKIKNLDEKIPTHLTSMPPSNLEILQELKDAGLKTISFDLECPGKEYFKKYCPGKSKSYGYNNIRKALVEALKIFGEGNVFTITIIGIEPARSFVKNMEPIIEDGIIPTLNVYHYDPLCSIDMDIKEVSLENVISISQEMSKLFKRKGISAGKLGCAHYDIGHEIRKGYF